ELARVPTWSPVRYGISSLSRRRRPGPSVALPIFPGSDAQKSRAPIGVSPGKWGLSRMAPRLLKGHAGWGWPAPRPRSAGPPDSRRTGRLTRRNGHGEEAVRGASVLADLHAERRRARRRHGPSAGTRHRL